MRSSKWLEQRRNAARVVPQVKDLQATVQQSGKIEPTEAEGVGPSLLKEGAAKAITDGSILEHYAEELIADYTKHYGDKVGSNVPKTLSYSTMFSGSDISSYCLEAVGSAMKMHGGPIEFKQLWCCENHKRKRQWLMDLTNRKVCAFQDASFMGGRSAPCETHKGRCAIHRPNILLCGFSCKDLSRQNNASNRQNLLKQTSSPGGSSNTFHYMLGHLDAHKPDIVIIENSDALCDGRENDDSNLSVALAELSSRGYDAQVTILNTSQYLLPSRRPRTYIVSVLEDSEMFEIKNYDAFFKFFVHMLKRAQRAPPDALDALLPNDHPLVKKELATLLQAPSAGAPWEPGSLDIHQKHYQSKNIRFGSLEFDASEESEWLEVLTARERDCLLFKKSFFVADAAHDLNQSIGRDCRSSVVAGKTLSPAILPSSKLWWIPRQRFQIGFESLAIQGFPIAKRPDLVEKYDDKFLQDLAGNAFSGTVVVAIMAAIVLFTPWRPFEAPDDDLGLGEVIERHDAKARHNRKLLGALATNNPEMTDWLTRYGSVPPSGPGLSSSAFAEAKAAVARSDALVAVQEQEQAVGVLVAASGQEDEKEAEGAGLQEKAGSGDAPHFPLPLGGLGERMMMGLELSSEEEAEEEETVYGTPIGDADGGSQVSDDATEACHKRKRVAAKAASRSTRKRPAASTGSFVG